MNTKLILETLKRTERPTNILLNIFLGGYNYKELKRKALYPTLPDFKSSGFGIEKTKNNFYALLSRLKKQGFVEKKQKRSGTFWKITPKGQKRLGKFKNIIKFPKLPYKREKDSGLNMVVFDIPEKHRAKRDWLRYVLLSLGFTMLQKSVWMGKNKLPEEFLKALKELDLINFVHILKIFKTGTVKESNLYFLFFDFYFLYYLFTLLNSFTIVKLLSKVKHS